jgi:lipoprotein-anchoring transpeptidase ErfK/SrfK
VFKNSTLLRQANARNTKIKVDISDQRISLYVNGEVALSSPCTTGAKRKLEPNTGVIRDKRTPKGTFRIQEKIADKRSTIFGEFYRGGRKVYKGDRRKYHGSGKYVGASLKHWMRLTSSGVGLHASAYVKRSPGTNGCIRLPYAVAGTIFEKVQTGTTVSIVD